MFHQIFLSPQVKQCTIIIYQHAIFKFLHKLLPKFAAGRAFIPTQEKKKRLRILEFSKMLENFSKTWRFNSHCCRVWQSDDSNISPPPKRAKHVIDQQLETTSSNAVLRDDHLISAEHLINQQ